MKNGWEETIVEAKDLKQINNSSNFTYSLWFYVRDWNSRFGEPKILLDRANNCPKITLGAMQNDIDIVMDCYPTSATTGTSTTSVSHTSERPVHGQAPGGHAKAGAACGAGHGLV